MALTPVKSPWQDRVPIAQLEPSAALDGRSVAGIVTLIWPYSASRKTFGLLLVEPDFRLRRLKGQVRLHFTGGSAKAVARAGVRSGDQLLLSLQDVELARDESKENTPGRGIDWELRFGERVVLQVWILHDSIGTRNLSQTSNRFNAKVKILWSLTSTIHPPPHQHKYLHRWSLTHPHLHLLASLSLAGLVPISTAILKRGHRQYS